MMDDWVAAGCGALRLALRREDASARCRWVVVGLLLCATLAARGDDDAASNGARAEETGAAREARLIEFAGGASVRVRRTEHYLIAYDTDEEVLREFVARVEATFRSVLRFLDTHDIPHQPLADRLEILFFDTPAGFEAFAQRIGAEVRGAAGFYQPRSNLAAFYNAHNAEQLVEVNGQIAQLQEQVSAAGRGRGQPAANAVSALRKLRASRDRLIEAINQMVVQHEVAHQVLFNAGLHVRGADNPPWVVEGLACLFESPPSADGAGLGAVNQYRLLNFREALTGGDWKNAKAEQYADAVAGDRLVTLRRLIGEKELLKPSGERADARYAQAWSLVYYLQNHRREDFSVYLTVLARRPNDRGYSPDQEVELFEATFGPIDAKLEQQWLKFILRQRVRPPG